jgi:putative ABC transport system permease protein
MSWKRFFRRARWNEERALELQAHLEIEADENVSRGMLLDEARYAANRKLGNTTQIREEIFHMNSMGFVETIWQDLRFAFRMLRKNIAFTSVAVLTLALGIGANTAIFSVVYAVLLQPLPYKNSSQLVVLNETTPRVGTVSVSYPNFLDWRAGSHTFSQMAAVAQMDFNLSGVSQPENIMGYAVSPNFLSMLGVQPMLGRDFDASEEKAGTAPVLMLSYALWRTHLGGDPNVIGRTILLDGHGYTIAAVLPPTMRMVEKTDVLLPIGVWATSDSDATSRGSRGDMVAVGRLATGATFAQAKVEMESIAARLAKQYPESDDHYSVTMMPLRQAFAGDMGPATLVLFGAVMFVLLIACANVANLFLVRGAARTREIALRLAFGASRRRIIRQMLTESFVLALLGGALGLLLAIGGMNGISRLISPDMLMGATVGLNSTVLLFAGGVVLLAAFLFGLAPAIQLTRVDLQDRLKEGGKSATSSAAQNRLRGVLAVAEISLALVLLAGAGLMMKSLDRLMKVDPGFRGDHVLKMNMELRTDQYTQKTARLNFWRQVLDRVRSLPGVESAGLGTATPLAGGHSRNDITIEGMAQPAPGNYPHPDMHMVSPGYISTLGVPLLLGRTFTDGDTPDTQRVAVVNQVLAKRFFPNSDPIGKRFFFGHPATDAPNWITIVGVVADTKLYGPENPARLEVYTCGFQGVTNHMELLVKSSGDPTALTASIRNIVASIDRDQPVFGIVSMNQLMRDWTSTRRITLVLLGMFSGLALILAAIGIYGVISYGVALRTQEIGIRMALGAQKRDVLRMVMGHGAKLALTGVAIGVIAALALTRLLSNMLFSVSASDPIVFICVPVLLMLVTLVACYIPAMRAMKVDPMVALRYE